MCGGAAPMATMAITSGEALKDLKNFMKSENKFEEL
jgi:hypothetical protein